MAEDAGFLTRWSRRKVQAQIGEPVDTPTPTPVADRDQAPPVSVAAVPTASSSSPATPSATDPAGAAQSVQAPAPKPPPPTLAEAQSLTSEADFTRFVARDVDPQVRNTALKTLFSDPRYNVMDGLDIYIDDYGKPDPLPAGMLRRMAQSSLLGLFAGEDKALAAGAGVDTRATTRTQPAGDADAHADAAAGADSPGDPTTVTQTTETTETAAPVAPSCHEPRPDEDPDLRLQPHDAAGRASADAGAAEDPRRDG
jgi:hypothetical protein